MNQAIFDPQAQSEFLEAVQYYEGCQDGLGRHFRLLVESAIKKIVESPFIYRTLKAPFRRYLLPNAKISIFNHLLY